MSGPKHLWSGDWEDESARAAARRGYQVLPEPEPEPEPAAEPEPTVPRNRNTIRYAGVIVALVLVVGVVLAATLAGSPKKRHQGRTTTSAATQTGTGPSGGAGIQTTPVVNLPSANWLGMQVVSSSSGAVVSSVQLGSPADGAGFEPGDEIDRINHQDIDSVTEVKTVTAKLRVGSRLRIQVTRGSTSIMLPLTMRKRPTITP